MDATADDPGRIPGRDRAAVLVESDDRRQCKQGDDQAGFAFIIQYARDLDFLAFLGARRHDDEGGSEYVRLAQSGIAT